MWARAREASSVALARPDAAASHDSRLRVLPAGVEGLAGLVEVDHERGMVGRDRLALARLPIDLDRDHPLRDRARRQKVVDAHAEVLVEVAGPVIPPGEPAADPRVELSELVMQAPLQERSERVALPT